MSIYVLILCRLVYLCENKQKTHVMRTQISPYVEVNGMSIGLMDFLKTWAVGSCSLKELRFKRDLTAWQSSALPWNEQPHKMIGCFMQTRHGELCKGVYEFWMRNDGMQGRVYKFDSLEDYNAYNPSQESPDAIKREIGLCANYHTGI